MIFGGGEEFIVVGKGNVQIFLGGKRLIFPNVCIVLGMEPNLPLVNHIMRHYPHLDVNFSNHKCYIVDKESKKTISLCMEDYGLFRLVDIR